MRKYTGYVFVTLKDLTQREKNELTLGTVFKFPDLRFIEYNMGSQGELIKTITKEFSCDKKKTFLIKCGDYFTCREILIGAFETLQKALEDNFGHMNTSKLSLFYTSFTVVEQTEIGIPPTEEEREITVATTTALFLKNPFSHVVGFCEKIGDVDRLIFRSGYATSSLLCLSAILFIMRDVPLMKEFLEKDVKIDRLKMFAKLFIKRELKMYQSPTNYPISFAAFLLQISGEIPNHNWSFRVDKVNGPVSAGKLMTLCEGFQYINRFLVPLFLELEKDHLFAMRKWVEIELGYDFLLAFGEGVKKAQKALRRKES